MILSANLGFLFRDVGLPGAIRTAKRNGFDAVECHWPFAHDPAQIKAVLDETGLPMIVLNTAPGDVKGGEFGVAALPGRESEARAHIDQGIDYAQKIGCRYVHVMAGKTDAAAAFDTFVANLKYGAEKAKATGVVLLVETLNTRDVPGYVVGDLGTGERVVNAVGAENVKFMFDIYHIQITDGDLLRSVERLMPIIGHVQFAAVPDRNEPDHGEVDNAWLLPAIQAVGYTGPFGAEYRAATGSLEWMKQFR